MARWVRGLDPTGRSLSFFQAPAEAEADEADSKAGSGDRSATDDKGDAGQRDITSESEFRKELEKIFKPKEEGALAKVGKIAEGTTENKTPEIYANPTKALKTIREEHPTDKLMNRAADFLEPILKANPKIRIEDVPNLKDPKSGEAALGLNFPDGRVQVDFAAHATTEEAHRTILHELLHAATREEINNNADFRNELRTHLEDIRKALGLPAKGPVGDVLIPALVSRGVIEPNKYGTTNEHELVAELFSNQKFRDMLADIKAPESTTEKPRNMLQKMFDTIARFFNRKYGAL
jgi:hypothetical protein